MAPAEPCGERGRVDTPEYRAQPWAAWLDGRQGATSFDKHCSPPPPTLHKLSESFDRFFSGWTPSRAVTVLVRPARTARRRSAASGARSALHASGQPLEGQLDG